MPTSWRSSRAKDIALPVIKWRAAISAKNSWRDAATKSASVVWEVNRSNGFAG